MCTVTQNGESAASRGRHDAIELGLTYGLILAGCWTPHPIARWIFWIGLTWIAAVLLSRPADWKHLGLGWRGSVRSLWLIAVALGVAVAAVLVAAHLRTLQKSAFASPEALWRRSWGYLIWALLQEIALQSIVLLRLLRLVRSSGRAIVVAAALFAGAHIPNPVLAPLAAIWGLAACWMFVRYRGVYTLGIAHAILGLAVALTFPHRLDRHMRVGLGYFTYTSHASLARVPHASLRLPAASQAWKLADYREMMREYSGYMVDSFQSKRIGYAVIEIHLLRG